MNRRAFILSTLALSIPLGLPFTIITRRKSDWKIIGHVHDAVVKEATRDTTYGSITFAKGTRVAFMESML